MGYLLTVPSEATRKTLRTIWRVNEDGVERENYHDITIHRYSSVNDQRPDIHHAATAFVGIMKAKPVNVPVKLSESASLDVYLKLAIENVK